MRPAARRLDSDMVLAPLPDAEARGPEEEERLAPVLTVPDWVRTSGFRRAELTGRAVGTGAADTGRSGISGKGPDSASSGKSGGVGRISASSDRSGTDGVLAGLSTGFCSPRVSSSWISRVSGGFSGISLVCISGANTATPPKPATLIQVASVPMLSVWSRPCMSGGREPKWVHPI